MRFRRWSLAASLLVIASACLVGCSSYRSDLRSARRGGSDGREEVPRIWSGRWQDANRPGHGGDMQLVLTRTGGTLYRAAARSQWWRVFRSAYDVNVVLTPVAPGEFLVHGEKEIWMFGGHTMTGHVTTNRFAGEYQVGKYRGRIDLSPAVGSPVPSSGQKSSDSGR